MACEDCTITLFGFQINRAKLAFVICSVTIIINMLFLAPLAIAEKVSMEECNERINNFSMSHTCYERKFDDTPPWLRTQNTIKNPIEDDGNETR